MEVKNLKENWNNNIDQTLARMGLETYPGCAAPLMESVRTEFGEQFLIDVFRGISDDEAKYAVYAALINNSII
jgi:hypothetical protein